jgi:phosphoribosyl-ATP pyrophosphohydrolase
MNTLIERSKTNPELCNTMCLINTLPNDIIRKIYEEYFEAKELCKEFLQKLESEDSKRLRHLSMMEITTQVLQHPCVVEYLRNKSSVFDYYYNEHFVLENPHYAQESRAESFILSILTHLYH